MIGAPYSPLVVGGEGLEQPPAEPKALQQRLAETYGVPSESVLPVRGAAHGLQLIARFAASEGGRRLWGNLAAYERHLQALNVAHTTERASADVVVLRRPGLEGTDIEDETALDGLVSARQLVCLDESFIEFSDRDSLASIATRRTQLVVLRDLSWAYGLAGAPCGALIAQPDLIARLQPFLEPFALATPVVKLAIAVLDPHKYGANQQRLAEVRAERRRMCAALRSHGVQVRESEAPFVLLAPADIDAVKAALRRVAAPHKVTPSGEILAPVRGQSANDAILAAVGAVDYAAPERRSEVVRETTETKIIARINLDAPSPIVVNTGIGFFDHMLTQVAAHGGFSMNLSCIGDLEVDPHHTIEDCALALGQALAQALGARRGIARFGFVLPMDEAQAAVTIDLGGRPYLQFDGAFSAASIGDFPTEMTEHVFRSLSQSMAAAIHVAVSGDNDHHMTEACFKAFGRALRQAIRVEGDLMPSTKGMLV